jgi:hypothetical protein
MLKPRAGRVEIRAGLCTPISAHQRVWHCCRSGHKRLDVWTKARRILAQTKLFGDGNQMPRGVRSDYELTISKITFIRMLCILRCMSLLCKYVRRSQQLYHHHHHNQYQWPYSPLLGPGRFFSFVIRYTVGRTPWTGDQPVARPLPTHRTTQT